MHAAYILIALTVTVLGCNPPPPEQTAFDPQLRALKKAKAVEGQLQQGAEQRREQAEAATAEPNPRPDTGYDYR